MRPNCPEFTFTRGSAPVEPVEQVERLEAQLESLVRGQGDQPGHRQVEVPVVGADGRVARQVAERAGRRLRERGAVEVVGQRPTVEVVADLVRPLVGNAR